MTEHIRVSTITAARQTFPRTTRQAFGHYVYDPLPRRITFLHGHRGGWLEVVAVVAFIWLVAAILE